MSDRPIRKIYVLIKQVPDQSAKAGINPDGTITLGLQGPIGGAVLTPASSAPRLAQPVEVRTENGTTITVGNISALTDRVAIIGVRSGGWKTEDLGGAARHPIQHIE